MEKSLLDPTAKVWIHQGAWLRTNAPRERRLFVKRWLKAQSDKDKKADHEIYMSLVSPSS
jgi:hypothetical protein